LFSKSAQAVENFFERSFCLLRTLKKTVHTKIIYSFSKERDEIIERHYQSALKSSVLASLLNETECYEPFDIEELSYQII
jgi:hypothetical protein